MIKPYTSRVSASAKSERSKQSQHDESQLVLHAEAEETAAEPASVDDHHKSDNDHHGCNDDDIYQALKALPSIMTACTDNMSVSGGGCGRVTSELMNGQEGSLSTGKLRAKR